MWHQFNEDAARIIESTAKGDVDRQLQTMTTIIVTFGTERFGVEEGRTITPNYTKGGDKIQQMWQELRTLARQYKVATEEEKPPPVEL